MIRYFPLPYAGESMYSIVSRYAEHIGVSSYRVIAKDLFGKVAETCGSLAPNKIEAFLNNTGLSMYIDFGEFLKQHTAFSMLTIFFNKSDKNNIEKLMLSSEKGNFLPPLLGLSHLGDDASTLYYCPLCLSEDIKKYGEGYWHIIHQVPGVRICVNHQAKLINRCSECGVRFSASHIKYNALGYQCICGADLTENVITNIENKEHLLGYAEDIEYIYKNKFSFEHRYVRETMYTRLEELNLLRRGGTINWKKTEQLVITYYGIGFLKIMNSFPIYYWVRRIFHNDETNMMNNMLLIRVLFGSIKGFIDYSFSSKGKNSIFPFGKGPWPCLNVVAQHYNQPVVHDCSVKYKSDKAYGTFRCECGFVYRKVGFINSEDNKNQQTFIVKKGPVWKEKAEKLLELNKEKKMLLSEVADSLGVSTIQIYKLKCKLKSAKMSHDKVKELRANKEMKKEILRKEIEFILSKSNKLTRSNIQKQASRAYAWLYVYDREWLYSVLPERSEKYHRHKEIR